VHPLGYRIRQGRTLFLDTANIGGKLLVKNCLF
jgi:hypothetical protein